MSSQTSNLQANLLKLMGDAKISNISISPKTVRLIDVLIDAHIVSSRSEYVRHAVMNFLTGRLQINPVQQTKLVIEDPNEIRIPKPDGGVWVYTVKPKGDVP